MAEWDDATFFDRVGVMRPRTGAVGVPSVGGMNVSAPQQPRALAPQSPATGPMGRPTGGGPGIEPPAPVAPTPGSMITPQPGGPMGGRGGASTDIQNTSTGAPAEVTMKFHPPSEPEPTPAQEPVENPNGVPITTEDGPQIVLNDAGKASYAGERLRAEDMFGPHPFMDDPHAPKPTFFPGKPAFNPFMNSWSGGA